MKYDAFISYSHTDIGLVGKIHRGLHVVGRRLGRLSALKVFRDATDLEANPELWPTVQSAIDDSRWFIAVLSPAFVESTWCTQELNHWIDLYGSERLLLVLVDGTLHWDKDRMAFAETSTSAPKPFTVPGFWESEPLHIAFSPEEDVDVDSGSFRDKVAGLAAPIHGIDKSELESQDLRELRRYKRLRSAIFIILTLLLVIAMVLALFAVNKAREATDQRNSALSLAWSSASQSMIADNPALALALAAEAMEVTESPTYQALSAMWNANLGFSNKHVQQIVSSIPTSTNDWTRFALDRTDSIIASGSPDGTLELWDLESGELVGEPHKFETNIVDLRFSPAEDRLVIVHPFGFSIFDHANHELLISNEPLTGDYEENHRVEIAPDGETFAISGGGLRIFAMKDGELLRQTPERWNPIWSMAFSPDGHRIASWEFEGLAVRDYETLEVIATSDELIMCGEACMDVEVFFSETGDELVAAYGLDLKAWKSDDLTLIEQPSKDIDTLGTLAEKSVQDLIWSERGIASVIEVIQTDRSDGSISNLQAQLLGITKLQNGNRYLSSLPDGSIQLWELSKPEEQLWSISPPMDSIPDSYSVILSRAVSRNGAFAAHSFPGNGTTLYDLKQRKVINSTSYAAESISFSPDSTSIVVQDHDEDVALSIPGLDIMEISDQTIIPAHWSLAGDRFVEVSNSGDVQAWTWPELSRLGVSFSIDPSETVTSLESERLVTSDYFERTVRIYNISTGKIETSITFDDHISPDSVLTPNAEQILVPYEGSILIYNVTDVSEPRTRIVPPHITGITFAYDGQVVITSENMHPGIRAWHFETGQEIGTLRVPNCTDIVSIYDGNDFLAERSDYSLTHLHIDLSPESACERVAPYVSLEQIQEYLPSGFETVCSYR